MLSPEQAFFTGRVPPAPNGPLDGNTTGAEAQLQGKSKHEPGGTPGNFTGGGNLTGHTVEYDPFIKRQLASCHLR